MKQSRVKRLLPQMAKWGVAHKEGTKYRFSMIGHLSDRSVFTDYKMAAHNERLAANRKQKDGGPEVPQLWEMDSSGVHRIRQPLGYFESGRAYWTEDQYRLGDPGPRQQKRLLMCRFVKPNERRVNAVPSDEIQYLSAPCDPISDRDLLRHIAVEAALTGERSQRHSYVAIAPNDFDPDLLRRERGYKPPAAS
jgi:hypothetical protein